jgi:hypothetical protein
MLTIPVILQAAYVLALLLGSKLFRVYLQISKALFGAFSYFRNASDAEFLEICGAMLSNVIIADLQKMHFAPNGFFQKHRRWMFCTVTHDSMGI